MSARVFLFFFKWNFPFKEERIMVPLEKAAVRGGRTVWHRRSYCKHNQSHTFSSHADGEKKKTRLKWCPDLKSKHKWTNLVLNFQFLLFLKSPRKKIPPWQHSSFLSLWLCTSFCIDMKHISKLCFGALSGSHTVPPFQGWILYKHVSSYFLATTSKINTSYVTEVKY